MDTAGMRARRRQRWVERAERVRDAFGLVLALVLTTYVLTSLLSNRGWTAVILVLATSTTSVVALTSSHVSHKFVRRAIGFSALSVGLAAIGAASGARIWLNLASLIQISLLAVAMGAVLRRVVTTPDVGSRTILGAISVYTVLGLLFTFLYGMIDRIQGGPFFEGQLHPHGGDFLFFSYTTLTTTGYGNLVPGGQPGRMIAGLVSLCRPGDALRRRQAEKRGDLAADAPDQAPS